MESEPCDGAGAMEMDHWSWSNGAEAMEKQVEQWNWSNGAGALELEHWRWSDGAGAMELERWSWSTGGDGDGALELEQRSCKAKPSLTPAPATHSKRILSGLPCKMWLITSA